MISLKCSANTISAMNVLGLVGSPRRGGNTDVLVDEILGGAKNAGCTVEKVYLYPARIEACIDCKTCKKGTYQCILKDDMQTLYPKLEDADAIVFGTPLYWYGPSAKMKLLQDRLRPYIASGRLKGKRAVLVVPSEEGEDACIHAVGMFSLSFHYLGVDLAGILLPKASDLGEVKSQPDVRAEARKIGEKLKRSA
jgi:multimeric flavodoxin WrbA